MVDNKLTLSDFISRRRQELDDEESELLNRLKAIRAERDHLDSAERVSFGTNTPQSEVERAIRKRKHGIRPGTIMEEIVDMLQQETGRHETQTQFYMALDIV